MFKHYLLGTCIIALFSIQIHAQDFDNYKTIRASGKIPDKFIMSSTEKYMKEAKEKISEDDNRHLRKTKDKFFLESNFGIDELLLSGKVLFNDPATVYVNKVMDELLKNDQKLRKEIEVYVIKSSAVNAFTTNNGFVFVCMGLLAQLENEAQLAYILAHELVHYQKQHALDKYVEVSNMERGLGQYRYKSYDEKLLARSNYSKEKETESDKEGLKLYLKTQYDLSSLDGVFDVLEYAHLPFDDVAFDKKFLETDDLVFPDDYFLKETKQIEPIEVDDEEHSTHPAVKLRRESIAEEVENSDNKGRKEYIVSKTDFEKIQKISRYEVANAYLQDRDYENAFYTAYLLMKENPNSIYLKKTILKSLYGLSKYNDAERYLEVHSDYEEIQGQSQQVYHLFEKLTSAELSVTALNYAWNLKKQYPDDVEIRDITSDLFTELVTYHFKSIDDLSKKSPTQKDQKLLAGNDSAAVGDSVAVDENVVKEKKRKGKYAKIKEQKLKEAADGSSQDKVEFAKYAFVSELKDTAFTNEFNRKVEERKKREELEELQSQKKYRRQERRAERINRNKGYALGLNKVVFISPFYYKVNEFKKEVKRIDSEEAQDRLNKTIQQNAKFAGLAYEMVDKKKLQANDVEAYNDLAILEDFIVLSFAHDDLELINHNREELQRLSKKYNTRYFCWTGVVAVKQVDFFKYSRNCYALAVYPLAPYFVYRLIRPKYVTNLYTLVFDAETGKSVLMNKQDYKFTDRQDVLNSSIYDLCLQLKNTRKK